MIRRMLEQLTDMVRLLLLKDPPTPSTSWTDSQTEDDRRRGQSEVSAAQSGPFHSEIPKSQSTVVNETPKLQSVVVNSRQEIFGIPTNINSSLGVIFESQEWGGSIAEDSECESREVNLTPSNVCTDSQIESTATRGSELNFFPCENPELPQTVVEEIEVLTPETIPAKFSGSMDKLQTNLAQETMYNSSFGMEFNPGNPTIDASPKESKVILNSSLEKLAYETASEELGNLGGKWMTSIENNWNDIKINSLVLDMPIAYKVFDALPQRELLLMNAIVDGKNSMSKDMKLLAVLLPYDRGKLRHVIGNEDESGFNECHCGLLVMKQPFMNAHVMFEKMSVMEVGVGDDSIKSLRTLRTVCGSIDTFGLFVFDPGKIFDMLLVLLWPIMSVMEF